MGFARCYSRALPGVLPRDINGALVLIDTLELGPGDLERRPGLDAATIARITERLGGNLPAELRELLERVGGLGEGIQTTMMDLGEGGDVEHLPIGVDGTGDLFLLLRDGTVWHGGERVAPTLGWFIARLGVEAWGRRQGEDGRTRRYLRELLEREV